MVTMTEPLERLAADWGPAMSELTDLQRRYVLAMLTDPLGNPSRWARDAGYDDRNDGAKVQGHYLSHNPKIQAAATEVARTHLGTFGPALGIGVMMMIARNPDHKDQLKAAAMLANRTGFHETSEHTVRVEHTDRTGAALIERIGRLAAALGVDATGLLGVNAAPRQIEGEVIDRPAQED